MSSITTAAKITPSSKPATLVWLTRADVQENQWEKVVAIPDFERAYPNIKINWINVAYSDFYAKQMTMNAGGTPPDLWVPYATVGSRGYEALGMVRDLTPFVRQDKFDISGIPQPVVDFFTIDGHIMGIPYSVVGSYVFYNKNLFQEAGLSFPTTSWDDRDWTLDTVAALAAKLTRNYGKPTNAVYGITGHLGQGTEAWQWHADPWSADGYTSGYPSKANFTAGPVEAAYSYVVDLIFKEKVVPSPSDLSAMNSTIDPFVSQRIAMSWTGGWGLHSYRDVKFQLGIAPFPWGKANTDPIWPDAYLMAVKTKYPDQTWALIKYLAGSEGMKGFIQSTGTTPAKQDYLLLWYKSYKTIPEEELKPVTEGSFKYGKIPPAHAFVDIARIKTAMANINGPMWHGTTPVSQALASVEEAVTKIIAPDATKRICWKGSATGVCSK